MNIRGTITEAAIKEHLLKSSRWIFNSPEGARVHNALKKVVGDVGSAFVLTHTPEQAEDRASCKTPRKALLTPTHLVY